MNAAAPRPTLPALTGLRFVAALQVLLFHRGQEWLAGAPAALRQAVAGGYLGVGLFFVLSGFILAYTYCHAPGVRPRPRPFYAARLARIYPVYLVGLLLALPFGLRDLAATAQPLRRLAHWAAELLLVQAWHPESACGLNCPGWSLSVEVFFYALFPFTSGVFFLAARWRGPAIAALTLLAVTPPALYHALAPEGLPRVGPESHTLLVSLVRYNPALHLAEFLVGILCAAWHVERAARGARVAGWSGPLVPAMLLALALAISESLPHLMLHNGLLAPLFGWLIVTLAQSQPTHGLARWLARPLPVLLGEASYSLYIAHMPVWMWYSALGKRLFDPAAVERSFPLYALLCVASAVALFKQVEVPGRTWLRARLAGAGPS